MDPRIADEIADEVKERFGTLASGAAR